MNKILILLLSIAIGFTSCKNYEKEVGKIQIAKQYYKVLDNSDYSAIAGWFSDSLITKEGQYEETYSLTEYLEFLKWDAVFDPSYTILEIEDEDGTVKAKISKSDKRIRFLHENPMITNQIIRFKEDRIIRVETEYANFDYATWEKNKNGLIKWVEDNHPELNGFINDQTEAGGLKFLKAIELYKNRK